MCNIMGLQPVSPISRRAFLHVELIDEQRHGGEIFTVDLSVTFSQTHIYTFMLKSTATGDAHLLLRY